jgi:hypothetical protein
MVIEVGTFGLSVMLTRMTNRSGSGGTGFAAPFQTVDLTPYFGTSGAIQTQKGLNAPCGAFSLTFADRLHPDYGDTVYALMEPMDFIELRASHQPESYSGSDLPLLMRGFVTSIQRQEQMSEDGTPYRTVVIVGQDSGKLLDQHHILFEFAATQGKIWVEQFRLQAAFGMQPNPITAGEFVREIVEKVVNPSINDMSVFTHTEMKPFQTDTVTVSDGKVAPQLAAQIDLVSIWQILESFADRPWNELFVIDREDGPHVVFRPCPYKSYADDSLIIHGAADPGAVPLDIKHVMSINVQRSDFRVANFFWVEPGISQVESNLFVTMAALQAGWPVDLEHDANTPTLFGPRKMSARSMLYPQDMSEVFPMLSDQDKAKMGTAWGQWQIARGRQLLHMNEDNASFEEGAITCRGDEALEIGKYLNLTRGSEISRFYIEGVVQQIRPLATWSTQLALIRGTGWRDRTKEATSPFAPEGRSGPYSI